MPDLTAADVSAWSKGRIPDDGGDGETTNMLNAALWVARREVGWHVSPTRTETLILDGPDSRQLPLPSRKVDAITSLKDAGKVIDPTAVNWVRGSHGAAMADRQIVVRKNSNAFWIGLYGGIEITLTHGLSDFQAQDWRQAIMSMVDQMSLVPISEALGVSEYGLQTKQVDDVEYRWAANVAAAEASLFSVGGILGKYSLPPLEFM